MFSWLAIIHILCDPMTTFSQFAIAPTRAQRISYVFLSMDLLFLYFTGYKVSTTEDLSQLKMLEIFQIQTQELMLPHKITKVCTAHIVLRLLGPLPLFQSDTLRMEQLRFPQVQCYSLQLRDSSLLLLTFLCYILKMCYPFLLSIHPLDLILPL